jgi:hypothetical protein
VQIKNKTVAAYQKMAIDKIKLRDYDGAVKEQETYLAGTGGFEAVCHVDEDGMYRLELRFVVASWDVDIEND